MPTATRQGLLPGVGKDRAKSVSTPQKRLHAPPVPQKGILVGRDWKIGADSLNVILLRRAKSKSGKETWATEGYFATLGSALVALVRQSIRDTDLESIQAVESKIAQLESDILRMAAGR